MGVTKTVTCTRRILIQYENWEKISQQEISIIPWYKHWHVPRHFFFKIGGFYRSRWSMWGLHRNRRLLWWCMHRNRRLLWWCMHRSRTVVWCIHRSRTVVWCIHRSRTVVWCIDRSKKSVLGLHKAEGQESDTLLWTVVGHNVQKKWAVNNCFLLLQHKKRQQ